MSNEQISIVLYNDLSEIQNLARELESFGERCGLSSKTKFELNLIVEEVVVNVISYSYRDNLRHEVLVRAGFEKGELTIEVEDDGAPFNPLQVAPPERGRSLEEMRVGGLGLHLVRKLTDNVSYERTEGRNRLVMRKKTEAANG